MVISACQCCFTILVTLWCITVHAYADKCVPLQGISIGGDLDLATVESAFRMPGSRFPSGDPTLPWGALLVGGPVTECTYGFETTVQFRSLIGTDTALYNTAHAFHPTAIDIFGDVESSASRRRCQPADDDNEALDLFDLHLKTTAVYTSFYSTIKFFPNCIEPMQSVMDDVGFPTSLLFNATDYNTPWGLSKDAVDRVYNYMLKYDGWNADGQLSRDFNRVPFSDFSAEDAKGNMHMPYTPCNSPWKLSIPDRWQPLQESDGLGYLIHQEHVTPYIGETARLYGFRSKADEEAFMSRRSPEPKYNYRKATKKVLKETRKMATSDFKKSAVEYFDNKFSSILPLKITWGLSNMIDELEFYKLTLAVQIAIYDSAILVWKEKLCHDLPRPRTRIKYDLGDKLVETYAGPGQGAQLIKASEWMPFLRTMPHSEYPSGSSCICKIYSEMLQLYTGTDVISPPLEVNFPAGGLRSEPGMSPNFDVQFNLNKWSEISDMCSQSRIWGGMHFEEAVPAGEELCGGTSLPKSIFDSLSLLVDGDPTGAIFKMDDTDFFVRPSTCCQKECPTP